MGRQCESDGVSPSSMLYCSWDEMMAALIDAGSPEGRASAKNAFRFFEHEGFARATRHSLRISKLKHIPQLRMMAACEEGKHSVTLYGCSPRDEPAAGYHIIGEIDTCVPGEAEGGEIFDVCYMPEHNVIALAVGDFSIQFWDCRPLAGRLPPTLQANAGKATNAASAASQSVSLASDSTGAADEEEQEDTSFGSSFAVEGGLVMKKRKPLPGAPRPAPSLPPADRTSIAAANKAKRRASVSGGGSSTDRDGEADNDDDAALLADDGDLGSPQEVKVVFTGKRGPLFIKKVHCPAPQRMLCWVGSMNKMLTAGVSPDVLVWHTFIQRVGFGSWDIRAHVRGMLTTHSRQVTDMCCMPDLGLIATAALDGTLCLWGVRGMNDGVGGRRGFNDSASFKPGQTAVAGANKGTSAGGVFLLQQHKDVHKRGIRCLQYLPSVRLMLSAGYESHIQIWDMTVDDGTPTYKLSGHGGGIIGMCSLEPEDCKFDSKANKQSAGLGGGTSGELVALRRKLVHYAHAVSIDEGGEMRWWDCSRDMALLDDNRCIQTFTPASVHLNKQRYPARGIACVRYAFDPYAYQGGDNPADSGTADGAVLEAAAGSANSVAGVVLAVGPRIKCFEAVRQDDDRAVPVAALYHDITMNVLAACQQDIRVFSAADGSLIRVHRGVLPADAAPGCVVFDSRRRKVLIGCNGGSILVINTFNCKVMKAMPRHYADVSGLAYCEEDTVVVSTAWDGSLHISDESLEDMDGEKQGILRRVKRAHGKGVAITALAFDYTLSLIATAGSSCTIHVWDYQDASFQGACIGHDAEISSLTFASPYPVLVSGDLAGVVNVWQVERGKPCICLASFGHSPPHPAAQVLRYTTAEEAVIFQRRECKKKVVDHFESVARRAMPAVGGDVSAGRKALLTLSSGPAVSQVSCDAVTSLSIIPPASSMVDRLVSPVGKVEAEKEDDESVADTSTRTSTADGAGPGGVAAAVAAEPPALSTSRSFIESARVPPSTSPDVQPPVATTYAGEVIPGPGRYPILVIGDETGRISYWDMGHVLEQIALEVPLSAGGDAKVKVVRGAVSGAHALFSPHSGTAAGSLATSSASAALQPPPARTVGLRRAIEALQPSRYPCATTSYHPRKLISRSGPSDKLVSMTLPPTIDALPFDTSATDEAGGSADGEVGAGGKMKRMQSHAKMTSPRGMPAQHSHSSSMLSSPSLASNVRHESRVSTSSSALKATASGAAAGHASSASALAQGSSIDSIIAPSFDLGANNASVALASDPWTFDLSDLAAQDAEEQLQQQGGPGSPDGSRPSSPGGTMLMQGSSSSSSAMDGDHLDASMMSLDGVMDHSSEGREHDRGAAAHRKRHDPVTQPAGPPSSHRIPLLARVIGDTWQPKHVLYVHGMFYGHGHGMQQQQQQQAGDATSKARSGSLGSPAGSLSATAASTTAKRGSLSSISDLGVPSGTGVMVTHGSSWKGFPVRSLRLAHTVELTCLVTAGDDGTIRVLTLDGKLLGALPVSTGRKPASEGGACGAAAAAEGASSSGMAWSVSLDYTSRDAVLTSSAEETLEAINEENEHSAAVEAALAANDRTQLDYSDVKSYERRQRRSSIVAAAMYLEPEVARKVAQDLAIAKAAQSGLQQADGDRGSSTGIARSKLIGQLFGSTTWEKSGMDVAKQKAVDEAMQKQADKKEKEKARRAARRASQAEAGAVASSRPASRVQTSQISGRSDEGDKSGPSAAQQALLSDPSVRTLIDLAKADVEERQAMLLATAGKPRLFRSTGKAAAEKSKAPQAGVAGESDDDDDAAGEGGHHAGGDGGSGDEEKEVTVADIRALTAAADKRLAKMRSQTGRSDQGSDIGSAAAKVNGVALEDPAKRAEMLRRMAKEKHAYPSLYAELSRTMMLETPKETKARRQSVVLGEGFDPTSMGSGATAIFKPASQLSKGAAGQPQPQVKMSAFLQANLHKLYNPTVAAPSAGSQSTGFAIGSLASLGSSAMPEVPSSKSATSSSSFLSPVKSSGEGGRSSLPSPTPYLSLSSTKEAVAAASSKQRPVVPHLRGLQSPSSKALMPVTSSGPTTAASQPDVQQPSRPIKAAAASSTATPNRQPVRLAKADALLNLLESEPTPAPQQDAEPDGQDQPPHPSSSTAASLAGLSPGARLEALSKYATMKGGLATSRHNIGDETVQQMLRARNPELVSQLNAARERGRRGSTLQSMSEAHVAAKLNTLVKHDDKMAEAAAARRASAHLDRAAVLDALAGMDIAGGLQIKGFEKDGAALAGGAAQSTRSPSPGTRQQQQQRQRGGGISKGPSFRVAALPTLSPDQYYVLSKRSRIGGQLKRDVLAFVDMIRRADTDGSGEISYEEFVAEVESGRTGLQHMKRHLESMFRAADKDGSGSLDIPELVDVMFTKATGQQKAEIIAFATYVGPPPRTIAESKEKAYSEETVAQLRELFNIYDTDGSGAIDKSEMAAALQAVAGLTGNSAFQLPVPGGRVTSGALEDANLVMSSADDSGDGEISFEEFVQLMAPAFEPDDF